MSSLPDPLVKAFQWASLGAEWMQDNAKSTFFMDAAEIPVSTWFSGFGAVEQCATMLNAAKQELCGNADEVFVPVGQYEKCSRCRSFCAPRLPESVCQHIDILHVLKDEDREVLRRITSQAQPEDDLEKQVWELVSQCELQTEGMCGRHLRRQCIRENILIESH